MFVTLEATGNLDEAVGIAVRGVPRSVSFGSWEDQPRTVLVTGVDGVKTEGEWDEPIRASRVLLVRVIKLVGLRETEALEERLVVWG